VRGSLSQHLKIIKENTVDLISEEELTTKLDASLKKRRPLKLKIGFDPTARDIHLGHTVLLRKLRKLQDLGHIVYLIIGDFTAKIGDPSARVVLRPVLDDKDIRSNAATYTSQVFKILDKKRTKVIYNSIWYKKMKLADFLSLLSSYTIARILERDDFSQRVKENKPLTLLEVIYPLIQGYDSVKLSADIEFGGTDQKFNLIVGRHLQETFKKIPQGIITMPILVGLDGKNKMSKSLDNYIGITEKPESMFGKIMSISDDVMWEYFKLLTDEDVDEFKEMHPKEAKLTLAEEITAFYHSAKKAKQSREEFERIFSKRKLPKDLAVYKAKDSSLDLAEVLHSSGLVSSKNDARRLISQGSISSVDENNPDLTKIIKTQTIDISPGQGLVLKVGKKRFLKIVI